jgi:hypothetical protein
VKEEKGKMSKSSEAIGAVGKQKRLSLSFMKKEKSGGDLAEKLREEGDRSSEKSKEKSKDKSNEKSKERSKDKSNEKLSEKDNSSEKEKEKEKEGKSIPHKLAHSTAGLVAMTFPSHHKHVDDKSGGENKSHDGASGGSSKKKEKEKKGKKEGESKRLSVSLTSLKDFATGGGEKSEDKSSGGGNKKKDNDAGSKKEKPRKGENGEEVHSGGASVSVEELSERSREDGDRSVDGAHAKDSSHTPSALLHQLSPRSMR